jgi:hypothetical protein
MMPLVALWLFLCVGSKRLEAMIVKDTTSALYTTRNAVGVTVNCHLKKLRYIWLGHQERYDRPRELTGTESCLLVRRGFETLLSDNTELSH